MLTDNSGLQVHKDGPGHVLLGTGLTEEGGEGVVMPAHGRLVGHGSVRLDPVLQTVELPAGVAHLNTRLTHVDGYTLALQREREREREMKGEREHKKSLHLARKREVAYSDGQLHKYKPDGDNGTVRTKILCFSVFLFGI